MIDITKWWSSFQLLVDIPSKRYINKQASLHLRLFWSVNLLWRKDEFYHFLQKYCGKWFILSHILKKKGFMHIFTKRFVWKSSNIHLLHYSTKKALIIDFNVNFKGTIYLYDKPSEWYQENKKLDHLFKRQNVVVIY